MARFFAIPFAQNGNKTAVPDALQADGNVSYTEGWGSDYELPNNDPAYKPISREQTNQMFADMTEAVSDVQKQGVLFWDTNFSYSQGAKVTGSDESQYKAVQANSGNDPVSDGGTNWVLDVNAPDASTTVRGIVELATTTETVAGTDAARAVTPLGLTAALNGAPNAEIIRDTSYAGFRTGEGIDIAVDDAANTITVSGEFASATNRGITRYSTDTENQSGTSIERAVTPSGLRNVLQLTERGRRTSNGTWVITSVIVDIPLFITMTNTTTDNVEISNMVGVRNPNVMSVIGGSSSNDASNVMMLVPSATTVQVDVSSVNAGTEVIAYQMS